MISEMGKMLKMRMDMRTTFLRLNLMTQTHVMMTLRMRMVMMNNLKGLEKRKKIKK